VESFVCNQENLEFNSFLDFEPMQVFKMFSRWFSLFQTKDFCTCSILNGLELLDSIAGCCSCLVSGQNLDLQLVRHLYNTEPVPIHLSHSSFCNIICR
jgi:hypothetical protein